MKRLKRILSMTVAGLFLATAAFGAVKQHKDLTGSDLHICKLHASTHAQGSTDALTNSTAEGMTGLTTFTQGDLLYYNSGTVLSKLGKDATATRYLSNTGTNNNPAWAQIALGTGVSGTLPIANGGTNASSFAQSNGLLYYNGTALVADAAALTSTYLPVATANGRLTNSVLIQDATSDISNSASNIIYASASLTAAQMNALIAANSGKTIILGAGTYNFASTYLNCNVPVTIRGQGVDSTIITWANSYGADLAASNVKFENLTMTMTTTGSTNRYLLSCTTDALTGIDFTNVNINVTGSTSGLHAALICTKPFSGTWRNVKINVVNTVGDAMGMYLNAWAGAGSTATLDMYNCTVSATESAGGTKYAVALSDLDSSSTCVWTINAYGSQFRAIGTGTNERRAVKTGASASAVFNGYNCYISGAEYDVAQATSSVLTLSNCTLANNTTSGTITYRSWTAFTSTLTWGTANPASITKVGRYTIIDGVCHFKLYITSADGNNASSLTATLPFTPKDIDALVAVSSSELVDTTYSNPIGYIDAADNTAGNRLLKFHSWSTATDAATVTVEVSGSYEL